MDLKSYERSPWRSEGVSLCRGLPGRRGLALELEAASFRGMSWREL